MSFRATGPRERNNGVIRLHMESISRISFEQPFVLVKRYLLEPSACRFRS
jgi:hypothetical protein